MLQLREKHLSDAKLWALAKDISEITKGSDTHFIINDRPDFARLLKCGLHLGQEDLPINISREIVHENTIIGLSTHSLLQAQIALDKKPDYIGFGPVYPTPTKAIPDPVVGLSLLTKAVESSSVPVVAIGGIDDTNIDEVLSTGAKNIAVVRYLMNTSDTENRLLFLMRKIKERGNK